MTHSSIPQDTTAEELPRARLMPVAIRILWEVPEGANPKCCNSDHPPKSLCESI